MKINKIISLFSIVFALSTSAAGVDVYDLSMSIRVPRVYDNTQSLGYRRYQTQRIQGLLYIKYHDDGMQEISISNLVNKTHKVNGKNVTYKAYTNTDFMYPRFNAIGSNRTLSFKRSSMSFTMIADPSYAVWQIPDQDNSLYVAVSGTGNVSKGGKSKKMSGTVSG